MHHDGHCMSKAEYMIQGCGPVLYDTKQKALHACGWMFDLSSRALITAWFKCVMEQHNKEIQLQNNRATSLVRCEIHSANKPAVHYFATLLMYASRWSLHARLPNT